MTHLSLEDHPHRKPLQIHCCLFFYREGWVKNGNQSLELMGLSSLVSSTCTPRKIKGASCHSCPFKVRLFQNRWVPLWFWFRVLFHLPQEPIYFSNRPPTVDGRNPPSPTKPWNDDSLVNTNNQWNPWFQSGAGFRPSTVWLGRFLPLFGLSLTAKSVFSQGARLRPPMRYKARWIDSPFDS